jgi:hypothetical protein
MQSPTRTFGSATLARFLSGEPLTTVEEADALERAIRLQSCEAFADPDIRSTRPKRRWWRFGRLAKA